MDLNENQKKAVRHVHGPMLVLAGAGSGKTRVVTQRILHLIHLGILPSEILAVTFTNKAAKEMSERIRQEEKAFVLTTTFHSLGAKILRESIDRLGYQKNFTIYDDDDKEKLLKSCFLDAEIKMDKGLVKEMKSYISAAKNGLLPPETSNFSSLGEDLPEFFSSLYFRYQEKLRVANAVDFDDLLFLTVILFKKDKDTLSFYQKRWLFLLIDEYQDTNHAQYLLAKMLTEKHQNFFAVGDPDQSIYSWRGALVQNILNFPKDFPGSTVVFLEENYRSTNRILKASNAVIAKNESRYEKKLWSRKGEGEKIGVYMAQNERQEALFVASTLEKICKDRHLSMKDVAIFYRTNAQSRSLEDLLLQRKIPYEIIGGISFYQRREVKDILAYLRLFLAPSDLVAFSRTINTPKRGIGPKAIEKLLQEASRKEKPILRFLQEEHLLSSVKLSQKQQLAIEKYVEGFAALQNFWQQHPDIASLIKEVITVFDYELVLREDPDSYEDRKENLEALAAKASEWQLESECASLHEFLEAVALSPSKREAPHDSIKLMTLHNAKGLEFPLVFIVGLEEDMLPHINTKYSPFLLEEDRRLFYVGMTRAKRFLYLSGAKERYLWGRSKSMEPSRFLREIPLEFLENYSPSEETTTFVKENEDFLFREGDWILHQEFGRGIVQKTYHTSYGPTYDIYFKESDSERSLVAKYAKLESLH